MAKGCQLLEKMGWCGSIHLAMAKACFICSKSAGKGKLVSHAHNRTNRRFKPNLRKVRVANGTNKMKVLICASCLKKEKQIQVKVTSN